MIGRNSKRHVWVLLCFVLPILGGCTAHNAELPEEIFDCEGVTPSYHADIVPIIQVYCSDSANGIDCHHAGAIYDLSQYTVLADRIATGHIEEHCIESREMPPPYTLGPKALPVDMIRQLNCWIENGYPEN